MIASKKLLIFKLLIFAFAFFIAFMPSTASRNKEVNSRVIVELLGIDGGDGVSITAQYVMPTETKGSTGKDVVTVSGATLTEAVESLDTALGRRAELGHCSMVVVGKDAEMSVLGTLLTATDITADAQLSAAEDKASDLIGELTDFMKKTGATDAGFIAYSAKKGHVATKTLLGFLSEMGSASHSSYMPVVQMIKPEGGSGESGKSGGSGESGKSGGEGGKSGESEQSGMKVEKLALYNARGRAGLLSREQARGVAWVSAQIEKGIVTADVESAGGAVENVSGRLLKKHASIETDCKAKKAKVKLRAFIEPNGDKFNTIMSIDRFGALTDIKKAFSEKIKGEIEDAYFASAALDCDPMFFARECYRFSPSCFESGFSLGDFSLDISVEIVIK